MEEFLTSQTYVELCPAINATDKPSTKTEDISIKEDEEVKHKIRTASTCLQEEENINPQICQGDYFTRERYLKEERIYSILETDQYKYIGETKNDLRDGFGRCEYKNNTIYIGEYKNNLKEGYGKLILDNGDIILGELKNNEFNGYVEHIYTKKNIIKKGCFVNKEYIDIIIIINDGLIYEGELQNDKLVTIGKLSYLTKPDHVYFGEILNYKEECGFGIFLIKNTSLYLGEMRDAVFENYVELYNYEGSSYFNLLRNGYRQGFGLNFSKDSKVECGIFDNDYKNGPFLNFSNCQSLSKSSIRMELYNNGFKVKSVDKMEASKKYIQLNYPEFDNIISFNVTGIIEKINNVVKIEFEYLHYLNDLCFPKEIKEQI